MYSLKVEATSLTETASPAAPSAIAPVASRNPLGQWVAGTRDPTRNRGRPLGARHKISNAFLLDGQKLWEEKGEDAMRRALLRDPMRFVEMVARLMPSKIERSGSEPLDDVTDERLATLLDALRMAAAARGQAPSAHSTIP